MPGPGRNQPCPCGSGRKDQALLRRTTRPRRRAARTRARRHALPRKPIDDLAGLSDHALDILSEGLIDLPGIDYSLLVTLPDPDRPRPATPARIESKTTTPTGAGTRSPQSPNRSTPRNNAPDSPTRSSHSATSTGIGRRQAAYALLDLNTPSTRLIGASLLEAVAVSVGAHRTPGGLQIAA